MNNYNKIFSTLNRDILTKEISHLLEHIDNLISVWEKDKDKKIRSYIFKESFYSLVESINDRYTAMKCVTANGDDFNANLESIYDICHKYFESLSMLLSFLDNSTYSIIEFEKLEPKDLNIIERYLAYYTYFANSITKTINSQQAGVNHKYTFLIVPDFKEDIFIDSVTNDHDISSENNILLIHIPYKKIKQRELNEGLILHEIGHHVGQSKELRSKRAKFYGECLISHILFPENLDDEGLNSILSDLKNSNSEIIETVVKSLSNNLFDNNWLDTEIVDFPKEELINNKGIPHYYYSEYLFDAMLKKLSSIFLDEKYVDSILCKAIEEMVETLGSPEEEIFACDPKLEKVFVNCINLDKNIIRLQYRNIFEFSIKSVLKYWLNNNINLFLIDNNPIKEIFRECCADVFMLCILTNSENEMQDYKFNIMLANEDWEHLNKFNRMRISLINKLIEEKREEKQKKVEHKFYNKIEEFNNTYLSSNTTLSYIYNKVFEYISILYDEFKSYDVNSTIDLIHAHSKSIE